MASNIRNSVHQNLVGLDVEKLKSSSDDVLKHLTQSQRQLVVAIIGGTKPDLTIEETHHLNEINRKINKWGDYEKPGKSSRAMMGDEDTHVTLVRTIKNYASRLFTPKTDYVSLGALKKAIHSKSQKDVIDPQTLEALRRYQLKFSNHANDFYSSIDKKSNKSMLEKSKEISELKAFVWKELEALDEISCRVAEKKDNKDSIILEHFKGHKARFRSMINGFRTEESLKSEKDGLIKIEKRYFDYATEFLIAYPQQTDNIFQNHKKTIEKIEEKLAKVARPVQPGQASSNPQPIPQPTSRQPNPQPISYVPADHSRGARRESWMS